MVRPLHVLALSADGRSVLLAGAPGGRASHSLLLDERLSRVVRGEDPDGVAAPAGLSPRDIQARLRAGASVAEVALEAGVPVARVERFAGPVRSEQEQVLRAAQSAFLRRARGGRSTLPLGAAVAAHLAAVAAAGPETIRWAAARDTGGAWSVSLEVVVRGRPRAAHWRYDQTGGEVHALDAYARQVGYAAATPAAEPPPALRRARRRAP